MKKLLFVYNPHAGKGVIHKHLSAILSIFEEAGYESVCHETTGPLDGKNTVAEEGSAYDLIVCFGGDGTLNEIVSGAMQLSKRPPIGFIPAGSTNDTAKNFALPHDFEEAARIAVTGRPMKTDIGSLGDMYFVYVAAFGDLSSVAAFTPQELKKKYGHAAYLMEGIKILPKMRYYPLQVVCEDGKEIEGEYFLGMVTNSFQVGGFSGITGKNVDLQDGLFEVLMLAKPRDIRDFEKQVEAVLIRKEDHSVDVTYGKIPDGENDYYEVVTKFRTAQLTIQSTEDVQWVIDGEDAGRHREISLKNHRQAIEIMVK